MAPPEPVPVIRRAHPYRLGPPATHPQRPARARETAPPGRVGKPVRAWGRIVALTLLIGVLLAGAGLIGAALWLDTSLQRTAALTDYPGRPAPGRGTTWLLVGSDSRQGLTVEQQQALSTGGDIGNGRTDTILLVHVPAFGSRSATTVVSIPRDSYLPIPGYGSDKINAAFAMGGPPLLAQTVEQATGLRLDHYVEVGFSGFASLVDALGGVTVCPSAAVDDPLAGIDMPAGCHRADGRAALGYVRSRATPRADLDRMVHQRELLSTLLHRAASPAVWLNPWRWYAVPRAAAGALTVDQAGHVWDLGRLGWALRGSTSTLTVPIGEFTGSDSGSVVVWNHDAARQLFDALASDAPLPSTASDTQP